jgi:hypothetical protein
VAWTGSDEAFLCGKAVRYTYIEHVSRLRHLDTPIVRPKRYSISHRRYLSYSIRSAHSYWYSHKTSPNMAKLKYASDRFTRQFALMDHFIDFNLPDLHYDLKEDEWMKKTDIGRYRGRRLHRQKPCQVIPLKDELRTVFERHNEDTFFRLEKRMQEAYHRYSRQGRHVHELGWALDGMRSKPLENHIQEVIRRKILVRSICEGKRIAPACISLAKVQWLLAINNSSQSSEEELILEAAYFLRFTVHWVTSRPEEIRCTISVGRSSGNLLPAGHFGNTPILKSMKEPFPKTRTVVSRLHLVVRPDRP